ncbi:MAG: hypothetical protein JW969_20445 [Spirochaetales bacterium]|nr:hypothetical protein [Spirochaetales bacterium]
MAKKEKKKPKKAQKQPRKKKTKGELNMDDLENASGGGYVPGSGSGMNKPGPSHHHENP